MAYAKVASAGGGTWHILLTERLTTHGGHEQSTDSARLWYARFTGRGWSDPTAVGVVHGAYTAGDYISDLVAIDSSRVAFAVPLAARVGSTAIGGVVLVRREQRRWSFDTLSGLMEPRYARLVRGPRPGAWTVLYVAPFFDNQRLINASLHAATYDGRWSAPRVVVRTAERALMDPKAFALPRAALVTWSRRAERSDSGTAPRIEWALVSLDDARPTRQRRPVVTGSNEYTATTLGADSVVWFARDGLAPDRVRVAVFSGDSVADLGTLRIRNETRLLAAPVSTGAVALISSEIGSRPAEPPATSILTVVKPVCPGA